MTSRRAVFLDRDGVINANRPDHVKSWREFQFLPQTLQALRKLAQTDLVILVATNQSAVGRGLMSDATVRDIHVRMTAAVGRAGGRLDAIYYCPHRPEDGCECRKPELGLYEQGVRDWAIDIAQSYVVGDAAVDVRAARALGAQPILVLTGRGRSEWERIKNDGLDLSVVPDLAGAVDWIFRREAAPA